MSKFIFLYFKLPKRKLENIIYILFSNLPLITNNYFTQKAVLYYLEYLLNKVLPSSVPSSVAIFSSFPIKFSYDSVIVDTSGFLATLVPSNV